MDAPGPADHRDKRLRDEKVPNPQSVEVVVVVVVEEEEFNVLLSC